MKEIYKTEFGSKLYGTSTPSSDTDYKTVVALELSHILLGKPIKSVVVTTGDSKGKNGADDVDDEFIPIQILADDFVGGQSYALEIVFGTLSEAHTAETVTDFTFVQFCEELADQFLTSNMKAMVGYAIGQSFKYGVKGTRLAAIEELEKYLDKCYGDDYDVCMRLGSMSHGAADEHANNVRLHNAKFDGKYLSDWIKESTNKYLKMTQYEAANDKMEDCIDAVDKIFPMSITVRDARKRVQKIIKSYGSRAKEAKDNGGIDWKAVSHAVRICYQALDILDNEKLVFPLPKDRCEFLLEIKQGKIEWEVISDLLGDLMDEIDKKQAKSLLPTKELCYETGYEEWKLKWLRWFHELDDVLE